jgi:putative aldouronate transport system permease protein
MINMARPKPSQPENDLSSGKELMDARTVSASQTGWKLHWRVFRKNIPRLLMTMPAVIWLLVFSYIPMFGIIIAFTDYKFDKGLLGSPWVGFQNFAYLFGTNIALRITRNTLWMNGLFIVTTTVISILVALLLYRIQRSFMTRFYQTALFFPYFCSMVIVGVFVYAFLGAEGVVNHAFVQNGMDKVSWYRSPEYWPFILTVVNLWKGVGFWSIVYFAGILAISPDIYEAAEVDGANGWQQSFFITLPLLSPIIIINVLLMIGKIFNADFGLFFNVTRDQPLLYPTTDVIDTFVFRALRTTGQVTQAAAAAFYQSVIGFALVLLSNWVVRRIDPEKSLF